MVGFCESLVMRQGVFFVGFRVFKTAHDDGHFVASVLYPQIYVK